MSECTYTEQEARKLAVTAAMAAMAGRPVPSLVTIGQAAEMLGVSIRTVTRRMPPRGIGGRIPYEWVLAQRTK